MTDSLLGQQDLQIDPNKDYSAELVGDGKKFASVKDLARGKVESDLFIEKLKQEQSILREDFLRLQTEYQTTASLKEIVDQLKNPDHKNPDVTTDNRDQQTFDPKHIESLITNKFSEMKLSERNENNRNLIKGKLQERYGESYAPAVKQQIDALGITEARFNEMASSEPQVLIRALGLDQPVRKEQSFDAPPRSNQRSDNFAPNAGSKRTWSYYEKLRKEKPTIYHDPKTQVQMHKDVITIGETAFYDSLN